MISASPTNAAGVESIFTVRAARKPHFSERRAFGWPLRKAGRQR